MVGSVDFFSAPGSVADHNDDNILFAWEPIQWKGPPTGSIEREDSADRTTAQASTDFAEMFENVKTPDIFQVEDDWHPQDNAMEITKQEETPNTTNPSKLHDQADPIHQESIYNLLPSAPGEDGSGDAGQLLRQQPVIDPYATASFDPLFGAYGIPQQVALQMQGQAGALPGSLPYGAVSYPWNVHANLMADPKVPMMPYHAAFPHYNSIVYGPTAFAQQAMPAIQHPMPQRQNRDQAPALEVVARQQELCDSRLNSPADDRLGPPKGDGSNRRQRSNSPSSGDDVAKPKYAPLEQRPHSWGRTRRFRYTTTGELEHGIRMDVEQMTEFLFENPRRLTLRIGRTPLGCNDRYGQDNGGDKGGAAKCRFKCCLDKKGTMEKGTYRVVLDELRGSSEHRHHDPFHNAGYVHLWCLERWVNFPALAADPNVDLVLDDGISHPINKAVIDKQHGGVRLGSDDEMREGQRFLDDLSLTRGRPPSDYPTHDLRGADPEYNLANDEDEEHGVYRGTMGHRMAIRKRDQDTALNRHDQKRPKADASAKSRFRDHLYDLAKQVPGRNRTRRPSGQKQIRSGKRRRESSVMREHVAREGRGRYTPHGNTRHDSPDVDELPPSKRRRVDSAQIKPEPRFGIGHLPHLPQSPVHRYGTRSVSRNNERLDSSYQPVAIGHAAPMIEALAAQPVEGYSPDNPASLPALPALTALPPDAMLEDGFEDLFC